MPQNPSPQKYSIQFPILLLVSIEHTLAKAQKRYYIFSQQLTDNESCAQLSVITFAMKYRQIIIQKE